MRTKPISFLVIILRISLGKHETTGEHTQTRGQRTSSRSGRAVSPWHRYLHWSARSLHSYPSRPSGATLQYLQRRRLRGNSTFLIKNLGRSSAFISEPGSNVLYSQLVRFVIVYSSSCTLKPFIPSDDESRDRACKSFVEGLCMIRHWPMNISSFIFI